MTPDQIRQRLSMTADLNRRHFHLYYWASKEIVCIIDNTKIRFRRRRGILYPLSPIFEGHILPHMGGTIIHGRFSTSSYPWFWLSAIFLYGCFSALVGNIPGMLGSLVLVFGFFIFVAVTLPFSKEDRTRIIDFLEYSLQCK